MTESGTSRRCGFTIVESAISLTVFSILIASLLAIWIETSGFVTLNDREMTTLLEGDRTFARISNVLGKSGRMTDVDGTVYPRVIDGGAALEFRVLEDLDGNGYAFDEDTRELEWSPGVFEIRLDAQGELAILEGGEKVYHLGRHVTSVGFETIDENSGLRLNEIQVNLETRRQTDDDFDVVHSVSGTLFMKN